MPETQRQRKRKIMLFQKTQRTPCRTGLVVTPFTLMVSIRFFAIDTHGARIIVIASTPGQGMFFCAGAGE
jgi:hypothetical protein